MATAVRFHDQFVAPMGGSFLEEALAGLSARPKRLPPKFFYDAEGSRLFDRICQLPEYYLTRTEERILAESADEIAALCGPDAWLVELGSGASHKVRLLLEALRPCRYLGVDISRDFLLESTRRLAADYPWLEVHAVWADFSQRLALPGSRACRRAVAFFPGSSIGNFSPREAQAFLHRLRVLLPVGSGVLIGVDLIKARAVLEAAYNDAAGVTAAFNLNVLRRLRDELGAELDVAAFDHSAFYNAAACRIEMHLVSRRPQCIRLGGRDFSFAAGETLHTENSCKYSLAGFQALARRAGYTPAAVWVDADRYFSVHFLRRDP
jgi:dimethylhistidine N-methyltransferase